MKNNVINFLKEEMKKQNVNIESLYYVTGVSKSTVYRYFSGDVKMPLEVVISIAKYLNIDLNIIFKFYPEYFGDINIKIERLDNKRKEKINNYINFLMDTKVDKKDKESINNLILSLSKK